jgi:hypothetical protein
MRFHAGAVLTAGFLSAGWQGMVGGCVTFGAFSLLMDTLLDHN